MQCVLCASGWAVGGGGGRGYETVYNDIHCVRLASGRVCVVYVECICLLVRCYYCCCIVYE